MPFKWRGKNLFLTYPQCDVEPRDLLTFLRRPRGGVGGNPTYILVGRERHQDGNFHLHAFAVSQRRWVFESESRFDYQDHHPNIAGNVHHPAECLAYCEKDGDTVEWGTRPNFDETTEVQRESRSALWARLLDTATSPSNFLQLVREADPYTFATRYQQLEGMANSVFRQRERYVSPYDPYEDFDAPPAVHDWLASQFDQEVRQCFAVIRAESGCEHSPVRASYPRYSRGRLVFID